ncbi:MAG: response regulator transcription factor [Actinobacteria bacterium]|nr:response regulator transcription factor [Actinomycetota bacterium]
MHPRRVLVVEDEAFTSGLVCAALRGGGFEVRPASSAAAARREVADFDPDAAVIDLNLGAGPNGVDLAHILSHQNPGVALLLLTKVPDLRAAGYTEADLPATCGFIRKEAVTDADLLVQAVESALADQVQRMKGQLDQASPLTALTQTQFAVLRLVAQGYTTPRIAELRGTTTSAVEKVLGSIYDALHIGKDDGISRRAEAMRIFVEYVGLPPRD